MEDVSAFPKQFRNDFFYYFFVSFIKLVPIVIFFSHFPQLNPAIFQLLSHKCWLISLFSEFFKAADDNFRFYLMDQRFSLFDRLFRIAEEFNFFRNYQYFGTSLLHYFGNRLLVVLFQNYRELKSTKLLLVQNLCRAEWY